MPEKPKKTSPEEKFKKLQKRVQADLDRDFGKGTYTVKYNGESRSVDQAKANEKKGSGASISTHLIGGARDYSIVDKNGKALGNSGKDLGIYKKYLWEAAKKENLYPLRDKSQGATGSITGDVDPYHIGLVQEYGDGTAIPRLFEQYPELKEMKTTKDFYNYIAEYKKNNPKDTTYDVIYNSYNKNPSATNAKKLLISRTPVKENSRQYKTTYKTAPETIPYSSSLVDNIPSFKNEITVSPEVIAARKKAEQQKRLKGYQNKVKFNPKQYKNDFFPEVEGGDQFLLNTPKEYEELTMYPKGFDFNSQLSQINSPNNEIAKINSPDNQISNINSIPLEDPLIKAKSFLGFPESFSFPNQTSTVNINPTDKPLSTSMLGGIAQPDVNTAVTNSTDPVIDKDSQMLDYYKKQLMFNPNDYETDFFPVIPDAENVSMVTPSTTPIVNANGNTTVKNKIDSTEKTRKFIPEWMNLVDFGINALSNNRELNYQKKQQDLNNMIIQQPQVVSYNKRQLKGDKTFMKEGGWNSDPKKPIYTSNKNDPKLKAYNDSLTVYKGGQEAQKYFNSKIEPLLKIGNETEAIKLWSDPVTGYESRPLPSFDKAYDRLKKLNKKSPSPQTIINSKYDKNFGVYGFKKPVQPIIFEDPKKLAKQQKLYEENKKAYESETGLSYEKLVKDAIKNGIKNNSRIGWTEKNVELFTYEKPISKVNKGTVIITDPKKETEVSIETVKKIETPVVETKKTPLGTINVEGKNIPYYSQEELNRFSVYKPTKVGDSNNYTISRFNSPLYFEGDKLYDKNTKKEIFKLGGERKLKKQSYKQGGEYEMSDREIERLKKLGYDFEIIT